MLPSLPSENTIVVFGRSETALTLPTVTPTGCPQFSVDPAMGA